MAGTILISNTSASSEEIMREILPQIKALLGDEHDEIAGMANVAAALHEVFRFHWIGFYRVCGNELVLGPFQGPVACTRIGFGKGVCGTSWSKNETVLVDDVDAFPGHIACSALSKSELVVPLRDTSGQVRAVLDIDSEHYAAFDAALQTGMEDICVMLAKQIYS
jgi:L-methionine (R)-S-oxide reductase